MSKFVRKTYSRVGREKQMYSAETGARMVAGCVALNSDKTEVIMIQSTSSRKEWILPKGGIEMDEVDFRSTARRETWEESGVVGEIERYLGKIESTRPSKKCEGAEEDNKKALNFLEFYFYEMRVTELADEYPEKHKRRRKWFTYTQAKNELERGDRSELLEALKRSRIIKTL